MDRDNFSSFILGVFFATGFIIILALVSSGEAERACKYANKSIHCELQWVPTATK